MLGLETDKKKNYYRTIIILVVNLFICLMLAPHVTAVDYPDSFTVAVLQEIQENLYNDNFSKALEMSDSLVALYPDNPSGYLFKSITVLMSIFDTEDNSAADLFKEGIDTVLVLATRTIDSCSECSPRQYAWIYLCRGHAKLYRSLWEARFGSKMKAITQARAAAGDYQQGLGVDSSLHDLYFGLGLYHYWKSAKAGFLRWLHIVKDEKELGIQELRVASEKSLISRHAARSALIWIWLDSKQYDSVIVLAREMAEAYPAGKSFLWPLAQAYFEQGDYQQAADVYKQLWSRYFEKPGNYYNLIECDYQLYQCYEKLSDDVRVQEIANRVHEYGQQIPMETRKRQQKKLMFLIRKASR